MLTWVEISWCEVTRRKPKIREDRKISLSPGKSGGLEAGEAPRSSPCASRLTNRRALLAVPLVAGLPFKTAWADEPGGGLRGILERRQLRILVSLGVPPLGYRDSSGAPNGFYVAIGRLLAEGLGVTPVFQDALPGERLARLLAGEADVAGDVALSTENARRVLLTTPISRADIVLAASVRHMLRRPMDLEDHPVGMLAGAGLEGVAQETLPASTRLLIYETTTALAAAAEQRLVHAVMLRRPVMQRFLLDFPRLGLTHRLVLTRRWTSLGVPFGEHDLLRALNSLIFIARAGGRISALSEAILGTPQVDLPGF